MDLNLEHQWQLDLNPGLQLDLKQGQHMDLNRGHQLDLNLGHQLDLNRGHQLDLNRGHQLDTFLVWICDFLFSCDSLPSVVPCDVNIHTMTYLWLVYYRMYIHMGLGPCAPTHHASTEPPSQVHNLDIFIYKFIIIYISVVWCTSLEHIREHIVEIDIGYDK